MKPPKRTLADHLAFATWIIFALVITLLMINVPQADADDFTEGQHNLAKEYIDGDIGVRGILFGIASGTIEMHNLISRQSNSGGDCILTTKEIDDLVEKAARDTLANRFPGSSIREIIVVATDLTCGLQTDNSIIKALY